MLLPLRDSTPTRRFPLVTLSLIFANSLIFFLVWASGKSEAVLFEFGLVPRRLFSPPTLSSDSTSFVLTPLFTHMFLHGGWLHIIFNMWGLWIFGDNVEDRLGPLRFLLFYLVGGLAAACCQILISPRSGVPMVGASGAIAAVMAGYLTMFPFSRVRSLLLHPLFLFWPITVELPSLLVLSIWFLSQVLAGLFWVPFSQSFSGGVAWWAHIGGFLAGLWLTRLLAPSRRSSSRPMAYYRWLE